jgi:hypothetical protein
MKRVAFFIYNNQIKTKKLNKKDINKDFIEFENEKYQIIPEYFYIMEKKKLFLRKYYYYIFYEYKNPIPIQINSKLDKNEKTDIKYLIYNDLIRKFFTPAEKDLLLIIIMLILGILGGIIIGIIAYPHLFPVSVPTPSPK